MTEPTQNQIEVLSIQTSTLGHSTYGALLRKYVSDASCQVESHWLEEGRDTFARIAGRIIGAQLPGEYPRSTNLDLRRYRAERVYGIMGQRIVRRVFSSQSHSVLHFHTQVAAYGSTRLMHQVPTIITGDMTATQVAREESSPSFRWTHQPSIKQDRKIFRLARQVVMWSQWAAQSVINDYAIDPSKVSVLYPGVDFEALTQWGAPQEARPQAHRSNDHAVKLLFVGGDFKRKGGYDLLKVFAENFGDKVQLHIITSAHINFSHPQVHFHYGVQAYTPQWAKFYQDCDVFVLPTHREAFGLALCEAMAMGLPVVSSRLNAIPEIVAHEETGFLVSPGNHLELAARLQDLIDNVSLRHAMGERAREVAKQKFDAKANFVKLRCLFQEAALGSVK